MGSRNVILWEIDFHAIEVDDLFHVLSWQKATDRSPIKTCWIMPFTGGQFRAKIETEPSMWF